MGMAVGCFALEGPLRLGLLLLLKLLHELLHRLWIHVHGGPRLLHVCIVWWARELLEWVRFLLGVLLYLLLHRLLHRLPWVLLLLLLPAATV